MMRAMKDSGIEWIGMIPEEWELRKLKAVITCKDGQRVPIDAGQRKSGIYPYWGAGSITDYVDSYLFDEKLVLLGEDGAPFFDKKRNVAFLINEKVWVNNHIHVLKADKMVVPEYLVHYLNIVDFGSYINGSILNKLTQSNMNNINIAFPNKVEQVKIAEFLDDKVGEIDVIISKTKASIAEYKKYRKAIVIKAVTKGLHPDVAMKKTDSDWIREIPAHWNYVRIQRLFETVDERNEDENALLLSLYTALGVKPRNELEEKGNKATTVINYKKVQKNDVIVNKLLAWMGAIGYSDYEGVTSPDYDVYRAREGANVVRNYYNEYFRNTCFNGDCYKYGHGIMLMRWRTYPEELLRIKVLNPPLEEQQEIAEYLAEKCGEIDALIAKKESFVEEMETYKKSLIYEYVTGKKEVK